MNNKNLTVSLSKFTETAMENGYEILTPKEVSAFYKENISKSISNELSDEEKDEFVANVTYLQKAICIESDGTEVIRYYRKEPIALSMIVDDNDVIKSVSGLYLDTPENKRLNRVGEKFDLTESIFDQIEKSEAVSKPESVHKYKDNELNRRMHRVGLPYTESDEDGEGKDGKPKKGSKFSEGMKVDVQMKNGVVQGTVRKIDGNKMSISMKDGGVKMFSLEAANIAIKKQS